MTSVTCVTTRYLPNLAHLIRLCEVDHVVILDLAPMPDRNIDSFVNRNRIINRASGLNQWLSVPVVRQRGLAVRATLVEPTDRRWKQKHTKSLELSYPEHDLVAPGFVKGLAKALEGSGDTILDVNNRTLSVLLTTLALDVGEIHFESDLVCEHGPNHRLEAALALGASRYVSGEVEWGLMGESGQRTLFAENGIAVSRPGDLAAGDEAITVKLLSSVHSICRHGIEQTEQVVRQLTQSLRMLRSDDGHDVGASVAHDGIDALPEEN